MNKSIAAIGLSFLTLFSTAYLQKVSAGCLDSECSSVTMDYTLIVGAKNLRYTAHLEAKRIDALQFSQIYFITKGYLRNNLGQIFPVKICGIGDIQRLQANPKLIDTPLCSYYYVSGDAIVEHLVEGQSRWSFVSWDYAKSSEPGKVVNIQTGAFQASFTAY